MNRALSIFLKTKEAPSYMEHCKSVTSTMNEISKKIRNAQQGIRAIKNEECATLIDQLQELEKYKFEMIINMHGVKAKQFLESSTDDDDDEVDHSEKESQEDAVLFEEEIGETEERVNEILEELKECALE
eukprot:TRINITY_DN427_c0_g1_i1.p1 TRINITY_DN427_c0_g1~~TRINITY_DN427_c0_g1_i1.p1  ORF type:complete len:130 (-),score=35.69 TRINITY_DN427_c0_g1_i1:50-439(-)